MHYNNFPSIYRALTAVRHRIQDLSEIGLRIIGRWGKPSLIEASLYEFR